MTQIRSFRNADLPVLVQLWTEHWSSVGHPPQITAPRLEQAVLSRSRFDPETLLLAETNGAPQGWLHFVHPTDPGQPGAICAACAAANCDSTLIAQLIDSACERIGGSGASQVKAGLIRDESIGYAGLDPVGYGIGVSAADVRVNEALTQCAFAPSLRVDRLTAITQGYRPPVSRTALQFRRSARIESNAFVFSQSPQASATSHLDIEVSHLFDGTGRELAEIRMWLSDPEAEVMNPSLAILEIAKIHDRGSLSEAESYLIASQIQTLSQRGISAVETVIDTDSSRLNGQLKQLHFQTVEHGAQWEKTL